MQSNVGTPVHDTHRGQRNLDHILQTLHHDVGAGRHAWSRPRIGLIEPDDGREHLDIPLEFLGQSGDVDDPTGKVEPGICFQADPCRLADLYHLSVEFVDPDLDQEFGEVGQLNDRLPPAYRISFANLGPLHPPSLFGVDHHPVNRSPDRESFQFGHHLGNVLPLLFQVSEGLPTSHLVDDLLRFELPTRFIQGDAGFFDVEVTLLLLQCRVELQVLTLEHRLVIADLGRSDRVLEVLDIIDMIIEELFVRCLGRFELVEFILQVLNGIRSVKLGNDLPGRHHGTFRDQEIELNFPAHLMRHIDLAGPGRPDAA